VAVVLVDNMETVKVQLALQIPVAVVAGLEMQMVEPVVQV
jgi:hypothetical protein